MTVRTVRTVRLTQSGQWLRGRGYAGGRHYADTTERGNAPTVRANPFKTNAGSAADGADTNPAS